MKPSEALQVLATILSDVVGKDSGGRVIPIVTRHNKTLVGNADNDPKIKHSSQSMRLIYRGTDRPQCVNHETKLLSDIDDRVKKGSSDDCIVSVSAAQYVENYTLSIMRCEPADIMRKIQNAFRSIPRDIDLKGFSEIDIGNVIDVTALGTDAAFVPQVNATIRVTYTTCTTTELDCIELCQSAELKILNKETAYGM